MSVAVVSPSPEVQRWARWAAEVADTPVVAGAASASVDGLEALVAAAPQVVLVDAMDDPAAAVALAAGLRDRVPDVAVILVGTLGAGELTSALRAGVFDVVDPAAPARELVEVLRRVGRQLPPATVVAPGVGGTTVVLAPKGGSGKTTVSANLAVELARRGESVVLVDLDVQFGDVSAVLGLEPGHDLSDAVGALHAGSGLKLTLTRHGSGCFVLCGPADPVVADSVGPEATRAVLEALAAEFTHVVVDTPAGLDEHTLGALGLATSVLVLTSTDVATIRSTAKCLDALDLVGVPPALRRLVVSRADATVGVRLEDIEAALGARVDAVVPQDRSVVVAANQGRAVVDHEPRSPAARSLAAIADRLTAQPDVSAGRRRGVWR